MAAKPRKPSRAVLKKQLTVSKQKTQQAKAQLHGMTEEIRNAQHGLRVQKARVARLSDQVRELQVRADEAVVRVRGATKRLAVAQLRVKKATIRLRAAERRLAAHQRRLSRRIARSYTTGTVTYADVLLRSASLSDFLDRQYYVDRIFNSDVEFLTELRKHQRIVARQRAELEQECAEQEAAKEEMELQLREVQSFKASREQLLERVQQDKTLKEQELLELQQESGSIRALLEQEWRRRLEIWRELYRSGRSYPLARWEGSWLRPVKGFPVSSGFGLRMHPVLGYARLHSGIDFATPVGTPIRAAADGEVIWASWRGGYGRCIILLHGGGVATLYAHCSETIVNPGQEVKRGQCIGFTGNTGLSTGPHLHFEMRVNGQPVNPIGH